MRKKILFFLLSTFLLANCKRKEDTTWDIDALAPVVHTTLTIDNLVEDSILSINSDNTVDLDYRFSFSPLENGFLLDMPDTVLQTGFGFPFINPVAISPGVPFWTDPTESEFDLGDAKLNYMEVASGELEYRIESEIGEETVFTYTISRSKDANGNPFTQTVSVPAGSRANPGVAIGSFTFDGYSFDLTGSAGNKFNTFSTVISGMVDASKSPVTVTNQDSVRIENKLISLEPSYVRGYLGQSSFSEGPTTNDFQVFEQIIGGTIDLDSVNIYTEIKNYAGAEAQVKLNQIISTNTRTGNNVPLSHSSIGSFVNLNRAIDNGNSISPGRSIINYTKANSNIDLVIENLSDEITTQLEAKINPLGNVSSGNDFLYFDKVIEADFHINVPLKFIANDLRLRQEIDLNVNENNNLVNNALLSIYAENGFPFDAKVLVYLLDENDVITDSIAVTGLISSATTDIDNKVTGPVNSVVEYAIPAEKMAIINRNPNVIVDVIFNTNSTTQTTIYKDYYLKLKLVTDMNLDINYR
ncbi:MAG: hypothetical protein ABF242_02620 [Flavobacteriales bacterium]